MGYALLIEMDKEVWEQYHTRGFISIYAFGKEGSGKTAYALWLGYKIYGSWDTVLKHLYLEPQPFLASMLRALERKRTLVYVIADDPGRWLHKFDWSDDKVRSFIRFYNIIRTSVAGIIFTSPADDVVKDIRKKAHIRSKVYRISRYMGKRKRRPKPVRQILSNVDVLKNFYGIDLEEEPYSVISHYSMEIDLKFNEYPILDGFEIYPTHYPDEVHEKYLEMRRQASIKDLKSMLRYWDRSHSVLNILKHFNEEELVSIGLFVMNKLLGVSMGKLEQLVPYSKATIHRRIKWVEAKLYEYISNLKGEEAAKAAIIPENGSGSQS